MRPNPQVLHALLLLSLADSMPTFKQVLDTL